MMRWGAALVVRSLGIALLVLVPARATAQTAPPSASAANPYIESHGDARERERFLPLVQEGPRALFVDPAGMQFHRAQFVEKLRRATDVRALYEEYIDAIGANGILDGIESVVPLCHHEAHELGRIIYARLREVAAGLQVCANRCNSGCMHGVIMGAFAQDRGAASVAGAVKQRMHEICFEEKAITSAYAPGDCAHGIGHAHMYVAGYDIPQALARCDRFDAPAMRYYCATGAYMEYVTERDQSDAAARSLFYPCDTTDYPSACARHKMGYVMQRHYRAGRTLEQLIQQCARLEGKFRLGCFHGLGNGHMVHIAGGQVSLREVCLQHGTRAEQDVCIEGALERMGRYYPQLATKTCATVDGDDRVVCARAAANAMYNMTKDLSLYGR